MELGKSGGGRGTVIFLLVRGRSGISRRSHRADGVEDRVGRMVNFLQIGEGKREMEAGKGGVQTCNMSNIDV